MTDSRPEIQNSLRGIFNNTIWLFKNLQEGNNRRKKIVERFKNRIPLPNMQDRKQQDTIIIDAALKALYNDGDKVTRSLQEDISDCPTVSKYRKRNGQDMGYYDQYRAW